MSIMQFTKMHGLGNDFVITSHDQVSGHNIVDLASRISDRNTGIGYDQFIVYKELSGPESYKMWIYNKDGSLAGACGNASRCVMKLLYAKYGIRYLELDVLGRILNCRVVSDEQFEVNMGKVSFNEEWMPSLEDIWNLIGSYKIYIQDLICADIGNRHLILFVDNTISEATKRLLGEFLEWHPLFKNGVNISFANVIGNKIYLQVWERYAGFTLACGSAACASVAAASKLELIKDKAEVHFSTGILDIEIKNNEIYMTGPATFVAEGNYYV